MIAGVCKYCSCTDENGCSLGCAWTDDTRTECTACLEAETLAEMVVRIITEAKGSARPRITLLTAAWSELALEQKQLLVMTVRAITERITQSLAGALEEDVRTDLIELDAIAGFLQEAKELQENESISTTIQRLLGPHIGKKVVLV